MQDPQKCTTKELRCFFKEYFSSAHAIPCSFQSFYLKQELYSPSIGKAVLATFVDLYKSNPREFSFEET